MSDNGKLTKEERIEIESQISKYWNLYNILDLATFYANQIFYFPKFCDFRGRIYTLSKYFTVIGDFARALLLVDDTENNIDRGSEAWSERESVRIINH